MKFTKIELLKVPFSPSYADVFDVRNNMTDGTRPSEILRDFYREQFDPLVVYDSTIVRSVKVVRGEAAATIYGEAFEIEKYNYCLLTNEGQTGFFFVVGVDSENDNNGQPVCTIRLKRDAWSSNIDELQSDVDDTNSIIRGHLPRYQSDSQGNLVPIFDNGAEYNQNPATVADTEYKSRVAWLAIRWGQAAEFTADIGTGAVIRPTPAGMLQFQSGLPVTFLPVAILTEKHTVVSVVKKVSIVDENGGTKTAFTGADALIIDDSRVAEAWLTYNAPLNYQIIDNSEVRIKQTQYVKMLHRVETGSSSAPHYNGPCFSCLSETDIENYHAEQQGASLNAKYNCEPDFPLTIEWNSSMYNLIKNELLDWNARMLQNNVAYYKDPKFYSYPYNFKKFKLAQKEYTCAPTGTLYETQFTVKKDTAAPLLSVDDKGKHVGFFSIPITSRAITSLDAYTAYLQTADPAARQSLALQLLGSLFGIMLAASTAGAGLAVVGAGMALGNYANNVSKVLDANSQDTIPAVNSQDDIETLDCPIVQNYTMIDEREKAALLWNFHRYGYASARGESLRTNYRYWFDYRQTQECSLPNMHNANDRAIIEAAYDKGLTRWHVDAYGTQINHEYRADVNLGASYNNPETEFVTYTPTLFKLDAFWDFKVVGTKTTRTGVWSKEEIVLPNQGTDEAISFTTWVEGTYDEMQTQEGVGLVCLPTSASTGAAFKTGGFQVLGMDSDFLAGPKTICFRLTAAALRSGKNAQIISPNSQSKSSLGVGAGSGSEPYHIYARRLGGGDYALAKATDGAYAGSGGYFKAFGNTENIVGKNIVMTFGSQSDPALGRIYADGELIAEFNLTTQVNYLDLTGTDGIVRCFVSKTSGINSQDWYSYTLSYFGIIRGAQGAEGVKKLNTILNDYV